MPETTNPPLHLRPSLKALAASPETGTMTALWSALSSEERQKAISNLLECSCAGDHSRTYASLAQLLKSRVQTILKRPTAEVAVKLERRQLPPAAIHSALIHYLMEDPAALLSRFMRLIESAEDAVHRVALIGNREGDLDRVDGAAKILLSDNPPDRVLVVLIAMYIQEKALRPALAPVLERLASQPLAESVEEAQAFRREIEDENDEPDEHEPSAEDDMMTEEIPETASAVEALDLPESEDDALEAEVLRMSDRLQALTIALREAADVAASGRPPQRSLGQEIQAVEEAFASVAREAVRRAEEIGVEVREVLQSTGEIRGLLDRCQAALESQGAETRRAGAREVLDLVLRITAPSPEVLEGAHAEASRLRLLIEEDSEEAMGAADALLDGTHPIAVLARMVSDADDLDPAEKVTAGQQVGTAYGMPLALALAFGQLVLGDPPVQEPSSAAESAVEDAQPAGPDPEAESPVVPALEVFVPPAEMETESSAEETAEPPVADAPAEIADAAAQEVIAEVSSTPVEAESEEKPSSERESGEEAPAAEPAGPEAVREESRDVLARPATDLAGLDWAALAREFAEASGADAARVAEEAVGRLLLDGRRGLAVHVGEWIAGAEEKPEVPNWLLRALALAPLITQPVSELAYALRDELAQLSDDILEGEDTRRNQALALLVAAASVRPALLAPSTLASSPLDRAHSHLGNRLSQLWAYCETIVTHSTRGIALDPSVLKGVRGQAAWEQAVADLRQRTEQWCAHAPRMNLKYAPATRVWMKWQEKDGVIHTLLQPVRENDASSADAVRELIEQLSDPQQVRRLVDYTDRKVIERKIGDPVGFKAYAQFSTRVREALDLAREWIALQEEAPGQSSSYRIEQADEVRKELLTRHKGVLHELDAFMADARQPLLRAAIRCMREAIEDLDAIFSATTPLLREDIAPARALNSELLRVPGVDLDDNWSLVESGNEAVDGREPRFEQVRAIFSALAEGPVPSWSEALAHRTEIGDHVGTELILVRMAASRSMSQDAIEELRRKRVRNIAQGRGVLRRMAEATEKKVDQAVMFGIIGEGERDDLMDRVRPVAESVETAEALHRMRAELDSVAEDLEDRRRVLVAEVEAEMLRQGIDALHPDYPRIAGVLARGDVLTAREYMHHVERGYPIREDSEEADGFAEFFPTAVRQLEQYRVPSPSHLVESLRERRPVSCVDMTRVPEPQARAAADAMEAWLRARSRRGTPENEVARVLFNFLGFNVLDVKTMEREGRGSRVWQEVFTEPVRDRARCPVAHYGSIPAGSFTDERARYRVMWIWDEPSVEDLMGAVGDTSHDAPAFVFYFGRLTEERRRSLARLSRKDRKTFLVLDDILLLFLCGEPAARMPVMFRCALPFTYLEPYVTTASLVPPEVFYGREEDRKAIMDIHGSCFIYGGRQLGKTALLRDVERRFHDPVDGRVALYVDLKGEGIGFNRPVEDIWTLLAEKFKALGVIHHSVLNHANPEKILAEIRKWLNAQSHRRILLLLDESDRFLEGDKDFVVVARLKKEMEDTSRRFKVVFAGLHNVQRTTRIGNNPLAHLGEPRCIGPLFENLEWRQARDLVKEPLAAIGYRFESEDLVVRILSQTNYYPSLLQLYCTQLLRHVNRPNVEIFDSRSGPSYVISAKHVEDAYQSQELWQRIRERFTWTLDLDPRYRLIAFLIAHNTSGDERERHREGFSASEIRHLALSWWERGFDDDKSEETFRVLLDEMVGLGILRYTDRGRYRMRTGNVTLLLGTSKEIEDALLTMSTQEPPTPYEAQTFRRPMPEKSGSEAARSPLTAQQEALLQKRENGVVVAFGTEAAGLSALPQVLPDVVGEKFLITLSYLTDRASFKRELDGLKGRTRDGVTLVVVEPSCVWTDYWVRDAAEKISMLKSKSNFVRILFVADPGKAWQVLSPSPAAWSELLRQRKIATFTLKPWHEATLRAWLDDQKVSGTLMERSVAAYTERTGAWPLLIYEMAASLSPNAPGRWESELPKFESTWADPDRLAARRKAFGLDFPGPAGVLPLLAIGEARPEELAEVGEIPLATVDKELHCLDLLGIAKPTALGAWELDPIVNRLLEAEVAHERVLVEPSGD